jgi:hypothetical protein
MGAGSDPGPHRRRKGGSPTERGGQAGFEVEGRLRSPGGPPSLEPIGGAAETLSGSSDLDRQHATGPGWQQRQVLRQDRQPAVLGCGRCCFRGEYSGSSVYLASHDSSTGEYLTMTYTTTSSSPQRWYPNDSASVSSHNCTISGTLTIQLYTGSTAQQETRCRGSRAAAVTRRTSRRSLSIAAGRRSTASMPRRPAASTTDVQQVIAVKGGSDPAPPTAREGRETAPLNALRFTSRCLRIGSANQPGPRSWSRTD